jgi:hypothetical protein
VSLVSGFFSSGLLSATADWLRGKVAKAGEHDPRLIEGVTVELLPLEVDLLPELLITVKLRDGRSGTAQGEVDELTAAAPFMTKAMFACGAAFGKPAPSTYGMAGLASDGWWRSASVATAKAARAWVRVLLNDAHMAEAAVDRFIASLDPPKREDLLRRATEQAGIGGF